MLTLVSMVIRPLSLYLSKYLIQILEIEKSLVDHQISASLHERWLSI